MSYGFSVFDDEPAPLVPCRACGADGYTECDCEED